jgi:ATP-dependent helicase/nuclease subunit A
MAAPVIPAWALGKQHQASDPNQSAWVSAHAGSGKTHVLTSRVIRLLLQGAAPSKILCLTFTKTAAANMAARIFEILTSWTQLPDDKLSQKITALGAPTPKIGELAAARKLFARALETPGGLKIQTIHAFCERLLHLFPFEANVPARFEVADDLVQAEMLQRARRSVLGGAHPGNGELATSIERTVDECGEEAFKDLVKEASGLRAIFHAQSPEELAGALRRTLHLAEGRTTGSIEREIAEGGIAPEQWSSIAETLSKGTPTDANNASKLRQALASYQSWSSGGPFDAFLQSYSSIFFTNEGGERSSLITKALAKANPDIEAALRAEQRRLGQLFAERKAAATLERTAALIEITSAILKRYNAEKAARGILDFDDLIEKTLILLGRSGARWVLFKLDAGIEHVLLDEAQDTSEDQWKILQHLTSEFAAGLGQSQCTRTFFAVGDEKQSIFSFQGAARDMFDEMRRKLKPQFMAAGQTFADVQLNLSFRSAPGVLSAIDKIFEHGNHKEGVTAESGWMPHEAWKRQLPALVEIWPLISAQQREKRGDWRLPLDLPGAQDPANAAALRAAQKIAHLIDPRSKEFVHDDETGEPRPARPGDILILVRKRGAFFEAMIRALRSKGIPCAGADRLELANHIAVMDLIAAGRVSLLPHDDLTLASLLKSPLLGLNDADLLALAPCRKGSLFDALHASQEPAHVSAAATLARWRSRAGGSPFLFYASLLSADGGRRAIETRLGSEAGDAIDEFLRLALAYEEASAPSLAAFLNEVQGLDYSIKRDMETGADAVRVMTVHAAKGLEAKIVFLPDTCSMPSPKHDPKVFVLPTNVPGQRTIAWSPGKDFDCEAVAAARKKLSNAAMEEYRRLLYVALSRAEERLYITGFHGARGPDDGCWAKMIEAALANAQGVEEVPAFWDSEARIRRIVSGGSGRPAIEAPPEGQTVAAALVRPDWLRRPAPAEPDAIATAKPPSAPTMTGRLEGSQPRPADRESLRRGRLIHLLLQYLPDVAPGERRTAALAFLSARASYLDDAARLRLAQEAADVIGLPGLAGLFGPGSKAEVSVAGRVEAGGRTILVNGRVDRIGETERDVFAADYKTGMPCPVDDTPAAYCAQLALYRAVLSPLWPHKTLHMLLIWTEGPSVAWLPAEMLDAAFATLAAP